MFLTAWFNTFLIVGYLKIIRVGIGILAVTVGAYFLRDYIKKRKQDALTCEITSTKTKTKIIQKLEKVLKNEKPLGIIIGIALIAFSINLIDLLCSAGIPAEHKSSIRFILKAMSAIPMIMPKGFSFFNTFSSF